MRPLLALALLALAGCATPAPDPYARDPDGATMDTLTLEEQGIAAPPFGALFPMHVVATFQVLEGGPVDVWLTNKSECSRFGLRDFAPAARATGERAGRLVADLPQGDGCLILDNADFAMGRAASTGNVTLRYAIEVWERT